MPGLPIQILAIVVSAIVFAPLCSWLALRRGRTWAAWFLFGIVLGPIAAGLLIAAPPGRCPSCGTRSKGWPRRCAGCGLNFSSRGSEPAGSGIGRTTGAPSQRESTAAAVASGPIAREAVGVLRPATGSRADGTVSVEALAHRPATALGRRPTTLKAAATSKASSPVAPRRSSGTVAILGSAIFMGGTEPLQIGSRYFLARIGPEMQALGPIHISPSAVAARIMLADTQATVVADRLLITGREGERGPTLAFSAVAIEPGVDLQEQLRVRGRRKAAVT